MKLTCYDYSFIVFLFFFLVYCESCIIIPTVQQLKCEVCQCLNPNGFPKVCLELDQFLEEQFCKEYALRRDAVQLKKVQLKHESATTCMCQCAVNSLYSSQCVYSLNLSMMLLK